MQRNGNKLLENLCDKVPVNQPNNIDPNFQNTAGMTGMSNTGTIQECADFPSIEDTIAVYGRLK